MDPHPYNESINHTHSVLIIGHGQGLLLETVGFGLMFLTGGVVELNCALFQCIMHHACFQCTVRMCVSMHVCFSGTRVNVLVYIRNKMYIT